MMLQERLHRGKENDSPSSRTRSRVQKATSLTDDTEKQRRASTNKRSRSSCDLRNDCRETDAAPLKRASSDLDNVTLQTPPSRLRSSNIEIKLKTTENTQKHAYANTVCPSPAPTIPNDILARLSARREAVASRRRQRQATPSNTPTRARYNSRQSRLQDPTWSALVKKKKTRSPRTGSSGVSKFEMDSVPEQNCPLSLLLIEIEPPTGVVRFRMTKTSEIETLKAKVNDSFKFITEALPHATKKMEQGTSGLLFQALLRNSCKSDDASTSSAIKMYASREDRAAGQCLDLTKLGGDAEMLSHRALELIELLRIKIEDDGDLGQAAKTLRDIRNFFTKVAENCQQKGGISESELLASFR